MSTSIAALPAYKSSKATRTKARADRTIFGTTLDNSTVASKVFRNQRVQSAAERLFEDRHKKWTTPTPSRQALLDGAWGIKNFTQPEIGEEYSTTYSRASSRHSTVSFDSTELDLPLPDKITDQNQDTEKTLKPQTPLVAFKDRFGVYNVLKENVEIQAHPIANKSNLPAKLEIVKRLGSPEKQLAPTQKARPLGERRRRVSSMSSHDSGRGSAKQPKWSGRNTQRGVQVPKFSMPASQRNYMRTSSLKITETGAKDLIHKESINQLGLGNTLQYNHEAFKKRETPNQYLDHGNVFSLGQRGNTTTTNREVTGPGGFYKMSTPEQTFNGRHFKNGEGASVYSLPYEPSISSRRTHDAARMKRSPQRPLAAEVATPAQLDDVIPLNIIHRYGADEVRKLLKDNEQEVKLALQEAEVSNLSHSGIVPPRVDVPELNHPIDPPPTYYSNFGQSLKYDKFDGGLHLYIH